MVESETPGSGTDYIDGSLVRRTVASPIKGCNPGGLRVGMTPDIGE